MTNKDTQRYIHAIASEAWRINDANGWWDARRAIMRSELPSATQHVVIACLGLVTSEVAEAIEAVRKQHPDTWADAKTKDTLVRELAGTVIRCMDLAVELRLPLGEAIAEELWANSTRGHKHGGKAA